MGSGGVTVRRRRSDGEATRKRIFAAALRLFRSKGIAPTTVREIAAEAGISPGLAYYYFPSKEAIVSAYFDEQQTEHERQARAAFAEAASLRERLGAVFQTKLDVVRRDRKLLGALSRGSTDPDDALSAFSPQTRAIRLRSIALFREALDHPSVPASQHETLALLLWGAHLLALILLVHDRSRGQRRTRELIDRVLDMAVPLVPLLSLPATERLLEEARTLLADAGLDVV